MNELEMAKARPLLSQGQTDSDLVESADFVNWQDAGFMLPNLLARLATVCVSSRLITLGTLPEPRLWGLTAACFGNVDQ